MTGRRSITEEARRRQQPNEDEAGIDDGDAVGPDGEDPDGENPDDEGDSTDRRKFTQRMPEELVEDIDEFADRHGMSRNAAINLLAKTGLDDF